MRCSTVLKRLAVTATVLLAASVLAAAATPAEVKEAKKAPKGPKPDVVFDGKDRELKQWQTKGKKSYWTVGSAKLDPANPRELAVSKDGNELVNAKGHGVDIYSKYVHGDAVIKMDVMVPKGSNSGIYVHGEYEIQVLDSYGNDKKAGRGDMGALYGAAPPKNPKYKKPGEWQTFEIHFIAPKFDADGKKTANATFVKVLLNDIVIHENVEMKGPTPGGVDRKEKARGPILFQGNHGPVAYRNIEVYPLK
jgi:hypothetical protein